MDPLFSDSCEHFSLFKQMQCIPAPLECALELLLLQSQQGRIFLLLLSCFSCGTLLDKAVSCSWMVFLMHWETSALAPLPVFFLKLKINLLECFFSISQQFFIFFVFLSLLSSSLFPLQPVTSRKTKNFLPLTI